MYFRKYFIKESINNEETRKGIASPAEYIASIFKPLEISPPMLEYIRMLPSIGPIHGDQPAANPTPTKKAPTGVPNLPVFIFNLNSLIKIFDFKSPIKSKPNKTKKTPPIILK